MQSVSFEQIFMKFTEIFILQDKFLCREKNIVKTISVAIINSSDVQCLDLYLIIILMKSTKADRCTDITFKLTLYSLSVTVEDLNI